jgi:hypothetical protein
MERRAGHRRGRARRWVVAVIAAAVAAAGCSSGDGAPTATAVAASDSAPGSGPLTELLRSVPPDHVELVTFGDLAATARLNEVERPDPAAGDEEAQRFVVAAAGGSHRVVLPILFTRADAGQSRQELGFSLADADQLLEAGAPPDALTVVAGRIDPDTVAAATAAHGARTGPLDAAGGEPFTLHRFGEEGELDIRQATPMRPLGNAGRPAVRDGLALWASTDATVHDAADAADATAGGPSVLDAPEVAAVAAALDRAGVYACHLLPSDKLRAPAGTSNRQELLEPWSHAGVGVGWRDGRRSFVVALAHRDQQAATANADLLRRIVTTGRSVVSDDPWSDLLTIVDIEVRDTTVVATFDHGGKDGLLGVVFQRDLIVHR